MTMYDELGVGLGVTAGVSLHMHSLPVTRAPSANAVIKAGKEHRHPEWHAEELPAEVLA